MFCTDTPGLSNSEGSLLLQHAALGRNPDLSTVECVGGEPALTTYINDAIAAASPLSQLLPLVDAALRTSLAAASPPLQAVALAPMQLVPGPLPALVPGLAPLTGPLPLPPGVLFDSLPAATSLLAKVGPAVPLAPGPALELPLPIPEQGGRAASAFVQAPVPAPVPQVAPRPSPGLPLAAPAPMAVPQPASAPGYSEQQQPRGVVALQLDLLGASPQGFAANQSLFIAAVANVSRSIFLPCRAWLDLR